MDDNQSAGPGAKAAESAGDGLGDRMEASLADERGKAAQASQTAVVTEIASRRTAEANEGLEVILAGASPDDANLMRQSLGLPKPPGSPRKTSDELAEDWRAGGYPYRYKMLRRDYEREKFILQTELLKLQSWVKEANQRVIILFEGRDAAGKGGAIKRFMEHLNPRGARVVALEKAQRGRTRAMVLPALC